MKKALSLLLSAILIIASFASVAVFAADGDVIYSNDFSKLPSNIVSENAESVTHKAGSSLRISTPAESGVVWSEYVQLSSAQIKGDTTISMYVRADWDGNTGGSWDNGMVIQFVQNSGGTAVTQLRVGPVNASLDYSADNSTWETPKIDGTENPKYVFSPETWRRIDLQIDRTNAKCVLYFNCEKVAEYALARPDLGYIQGIRLNRVSNQAKINHYYVDNVLIRQTLAEPTADDIYARGNVSELLGSADTLVYQPFDAMPTQTSGTTNLRNIAPVGMDSKYVEVLGESGANLNTYIPFSDSAITGNTTVSFALKTAVKDMKHSGMKLMLTTADGKAIGGIAVGSDNYMQYIRNGEAITVRDAGGRKVMVKGNNWGTLDLLINSEKNSVTVFYNGTRIRSFAMDDGNAGFAGITLTKLGEGTSDISCGLDDISVVSGLYAPTSAQALSASDSIMDVDADYEEDSKDKKEESDDKADDEEKNGTTDTESDGGAFEATGSSEEAKEKGGCGSSVGLGYSLIMIACLLSVAAVSTVRKRSVR